MTGGFSHRDPGTDEAVWRDELTRRVLPTLDTDIDVLVVVAAHPDDETLGAGGLLARAARAGARVRVVIATDGEASHPDSPTHDRETLAARRRGEVSDAVALLGVDADVTFLGLPDGELQAVRPVLREALGRLFDELPSDPRRVLVAAPWAQDRHRDHRIVAEVARELTTRRFRYVEYPIWAWHWGAPDDLPWDRMIALPLSDDDRRAKHRALGCHLSQIAPLSDQPGDEVLLHEGMQAHFKRAAEVFIATEGAAQSLDAQWFDDFYRRNGADPWGFESRWYEKRKRAVLMAALPAAALGEVLEIGCATGLLTLELAARAGHVIAMDAATAAADAAASRFRGDDRVTVLHGRVPDDWPEGRFDTIILSEVGYYLSPADLERTLALIEASLADDGCLVACHWRHPVAAYPQTGDDVHAAVHAVGAWEAIASHVEKDFVLEVFARPGAKSVAEREGLV